MDSVYCAKSWHALLPHVTCLALKRILFHVLFLENLEAGNLQVVCTSHPELSKVMVGLPWHLSLAGVLLFLAVASSLEANLTNLIHQSSGR